MTAMIAARYTRTMTAAVDRKVAADQLALPDEIRQSVVLLRFAEPVPRAFCHHFVRIRLTEEMKTRGEEKFHRLTQVQPHRAGIRPCRYCGGERSQQSPSAQCCENPACQYYKVPVECGPLRGVLKILVASDFVEEGDRLNAVGLVLDRRYDDDVLAAVYRAAGQLCDEMGWRLK